MTLLVLVGPKGSGKTHVGAVLEARLGVRFVRVEPIFLALRNQVEALTEVERQVDRALAEAQVVAIESTALSRSTCGVCGSVMSRFGGFALMPLLRAACGGSRRVTLLVVSRFPRSGFARSTRARRERASTGIACSITIAG